MNLDFYYFLASAALPAVPAPQATTTNNPDLTVKNLTIPSTIPSPVSVTSSTHSVVVVVLPSRCPVASVDVPAPDTCTPKPKMEGRGEANRPKTWKFMLKSKALPVQGVYVVALPAVHSTRLCKTV